MELIEPALVAAFAAVAAASSSCCARLAIVFVSSFACYVLLPLPLHTARFIVHWVRSQYFGDAFNSELAEILLWLEVKGQTINR